MLGLEPLPYHDVRRTTAYEAGREELRPAEPLPAGQIIKGQEKRGNIIKQRDTVRRENSLRSVIPPLLHKRTRQVLPSRQNDCNVRHEREHDAAEWEQDFKCTEPFDKDTDEAPFARPHMNHSQTKSETNKWRKTVEKRERKGLE